MPYFNQEFRSVFYVQDYEKALSFYRDILDLRAPYSWDYAADDRGTKFQVAGGMLEIIHRKPEICWVKTYQNSIYLISSAQGSVFRGHFLKHLYSLLSF